MGRNEKTNDGYRVTWITPELAVGRAPMSPRDLEGIAAQGVGAIVNLCAEYCDLHDLEGDAGFNVHYLPIEDACAPDETALTAGIEWVKAQIAAGRRVLVHCRFGMGRTGTFVTAFLLVTGHSLKSAGRLLKKSCAQPANHCQWRFLKKFDHRLAR